jgi:hypothetical protein
MPAGLWIARSFFIAGGLLALAGLVLWRILPIPLSVPPYLLTSLLAVGYGLVCWRNSRRPVARKEEPRE